LFFIFEYNPDSADISLHPFPIYRQDSKDYRKGENSIKKSSVYFIITLIVAVLFFPRYQDNRPKLEELLKSDLKVATEAFLKEKCQMDTTITSIRFYNFMLEGMVWEAKIKTSYGEVEITGSTRKTYTDITPFNGCVFEERYVLERDQQRFIPTTRALYDFKSPFPTELDILIRFIYKLLAYLVFLSIGSILCIKTWKKEKRGS
jgi:hypothetical protein